MLCRVCAKMFAKSKIYLILTSSNDTFKLRDDFYGILVGIRNNCGLLHMQAPFKRDCSEAFVFMTGVEVLSNLIKS